jgi:invasion protein IalB
LKRGRIDAVVTQRPGEKTFDVVNFDVGYQAKSGSSAELDIDGQQTKLFTNKEAAWTADAATDKATTEALAKGHHATLKATSARDTVTTDTYNLDGFKAALDETDKACDIKR